MSYKKMTISVLFVIAFCGGCSAEQNSELFTVYNKDDRTSLSGASEEVAHYAPTVALLSQKHRSPSPQNLNLSAPKLGAVFDMCMDEAFVEDKTVGDCTGFLVAKNLLLTAGHCVKSESACSKRTIIFNFHHQNQSTVRSSDLYFCKSIAARLEAHEGDLALIELDRVVELNQSQALLKIEDFVPETKESMRILSHPFGVSLKLSVLESSPEHDGTFFFAQADVSGGSSGAPVFHPATGKLAGVVVGGESDLVWDEKSQCNRNKVCEDYRCKGEKFASPSTVLKLMNAYQTQSK